MTAAVAGAGSGSGTGHPLWHLILPVVVSAGVFAGLKVWEWWQTHSRSVREPWTRPSTPVLALALASLGASVIHAAVCPAHFREATAFGVFFVVASALQAAWALLVLRRAGRTLLMVGFVGNIAVVGLWAVSRTVGIPVGPDVWHPEAITGADSLATTLELA
ncbi:MAG TPA: hypothetical protein VNY84_02635, partial [Acidimicrobiales bacterium]|nr:hypothetical protein [Acidimicrobiales bacterium]